MTCQLLAPLASAPCAPQLQLLPLAPAAACPHLVLSTVQELQQQQDTQQGWAVRAHMAAQQQQRRQQATLAGLQHTVAACWGW